MIFWLVGQQVNKYPFKFQITFAEVLNCVEVESYGELLHSHWLVLFVWAFHFFLVCSYYLAHFQNYYVL